MAYGLDFFRKLYIHRVISWLKIFEKNEMDLGWWITMFTGKREIPSFKGKDVLW